VIAFVREVSPQLAHCELSLIERVALDAARAQRQHQRYAAELHALGCELEWLAPLPAHADGVFVEDTAVLVPELAVITRPGVASRLGEVDSVAVALVRHLPVTRLGEPATLDGGDVLRIGHSLYVGVSGRSNAAGIAQLGAALAPLGYSVRPVALSGCLHLKSACTFIPPEVLLVNPRWVDPAVFAGTVPLGVHADEPYAANTLTVGGVTLVSSAYPRTQQRLERAGIATRVLEVDELHKAEAALTCMSLMLERP
jgi:dimethylargininase